MSIDEISLHKALEDPSIDADEIIKLLEEEHDAEEINQLERSSDSLAVTRLPIHIECSNQSRFVAFLHIEWSTAFELCNIQYRSSCCLTTIPRQHDIKIAMDFH
jgi:hypothetical protein